MPEQTRIPRTIFGTFTIEATTDPALIPEEVAGSSRRRPRIPATPGSERPALAGNPRLSPLRPEAPRPACHAGSRGFESRRSRKNTCKSASFDAARPPAFRASCTDPARESAANPRREPRVAGNPRKRMPGPPGRRSVGHRSKSAVLAGVSRSQRTPSAGIPRGSRVSRSCSLIELGN